MRIPVPDWDSESTAEAAIELFDTNGDTGIDLREANAAPGLAASIARIDVDSNKERTQEAIRNRLAWHERRGDGLRGESYAILVSGRPLNGAPVDGVSAVILGDVIDGDCAINDEYGNMAPSTEGESVPGLRLQFYCLEVDSDGVAATNRLSLT